MEVNVVDDTREHCGNDVGLRIGGKANVADETFVENFVNLSAIVDGALRFADDACALGWCGESGMMDTVDETKRGVDSRRSRHEWEILRRC